MTGKRRREEEMHITITSVITRALLLLVTFLFLVPTSTALGKDEEKENKKTKLVVVTNNHTNYLSVRCFSFDDEFNVVHLKPWAQFKFKVHIRKIYPSATMFNCSTNMGTFVAFKYNYHCSQDIYESCDWRFDEENVYRWNPKLKTWFSYNYDPNYESLSRGGVIRGYFAN
ncbi:Uncharacterized protein Adt_12722 [Abeliophyllum distichum]|uniref:S-protein homolog n=1 Tax=Abeliophyllum distichum TaxID=126358 RepID=A0ABD1URH8_9LAMI